MAKRYVLVDDLGGILGFGNRTMILEDRAGAERLALILNGDCHDPDVYISVQYYTPELVKEDK